VPLGYIADKIGQKKVIIMGVLTQIISVLCIILMPDSKGYHLYLIAIYIAASCYSGADVSLLRSYYSSNNDTEFKKFQFRLHEKFYMYSIIFLIIGSATFYFNYSVPFYVQIVSFLISLFYLFLLPECNYRDSKIKDMLAKRHELPLVFKNILADNKFISLIFIQGIFASAIALNHKSIQSQWVGLWGENSVFCFGVFYAIGNVFSAQGARLFQLASRKIKTLYGELLLLLIALSFAFCFLVIPVGLITVLGFLILCIFKGAYRPLFIAEISKRVVIKPMMSTVLSSAALIGSVVVAVIHYGLAPLYSDIYLGNLVFVGIAIVVIPFMILIYKRKVKWSYKLSKQPLTQKENILVIDGEDIIMKQKYPKWIDVEHFSKLIQILEKPIYPSSTYNINATSFSSETQYLGSKSMVNLTPSDQLSCCKRIFENFIERKNIGYEANIASYDDIFSDFLSSSLKKKLCSSEMVRVIHGDLHPENILIVDNEPYVIDWDLSGIGYRWFDLLTLLTSPYLKFSKKNKINFFKEQFAEFSEEEISLLFEKFCLFKTNQLGDYSKTDKKLYKLSQLYSNHAKQFCYTK